MLDWLQKIFNRIFGCFSFTQTLIVSTILHVLIFALTAFTFGPSKSKPIRIDKTKVVWTQTVKSKKITPKDKLPPPDVAKVKPKKKVLKKVNLDPKKPKKPKKKEPKVDRKKLLEEAMAKLKSQDDRPAPKDDNFSTTDQTSTPQMLSSDEADAIRASPELLAYTEVINELVVGNFLWYQSEKNLTTLVEIKLGADGSAENIQVIESSGNASFDQATQRAIQKSSPFPAPTGRLIPLFKQETIVFTFDGSQL